MNPKIKWVKNSRVERNPRFNMVNVVKDNYYSQHGEIIVRMINSSKKYPIINIEFPSETETVERKEKNTAGKWITKSWVTKHKVIASINTEENYIHLDRTRFKPSELNNLIKVINKVKEVVLNEVEVVLW